MIDPNALIGNEVDPIFTGVGNRINAQLLPMCEFCREHDDLRWLIEQFARVLNPLDNETIHSSVNGLGFFVEADIEVFQGHLCGPCWFFLSPTVPYADCDKILDSYDDCIFDEYDDSVCDNGNLYSDARDNPPVALLAPDGVAAYLKAKYICDACDLVLDDDEIIQALKEFAEFIENCCQDAIDEVNIAIRRRYRYYR